jgi:hypothetical protein
MEAAFAPASRRLGGYLNEVLVAAASGENTVLVHAVALAPRDNAKRDAYVEIIRRKSMRDDMLPNGCHSVAKEYQHTGKYGGRSKKIFRRAKNLTIPAHTVNILLKNVDGWMLSNRRKWGKER